MTSPDPQTQFDQIQDVNVRSALSLVSPDDLKARFPVTEQSAKTVIRDREILKQVLAGEDDRLVIIAGPCSIHDTNAAMDYAQRLAKLAKQVEERMLVIMRVYFEKPRTTTGWKGLIYDPDLNDTFEMERGISIARELLIKINELGLSTATEFLDPFVPQYIADLISWAAIGARTTESQTHRQMASGLSMPVGFKNSTTGDLQIAINAMLSSRAPHAFLGIDGEGRACVINTKGNPWGHAILRGGDGMKNFDPTSIANASALLEQNNLSPALMIDCSHANCDKQFEKEAEVWKSVIQQRAEGNSNIFGLMLESNIDEGAQKLTDDLSALKYGVSITDQCVGWEETEELFLWGYDQLG